MNPNRYDPLRHNDDVFPDDEEEPFECDITENNCDDRVLIGKKKKHGVWCTILTKLHLKKDRHCSDKDHKHHHKRRLNFAHLKLKLKKRRHKQAFDDVTTRCLSDDNDCLITLNKESSAIPGEPVSYRGRRVDIAIIPERYHLLEEVDYDEISTMNDSGIHEDSLCSSDEQSGDDVMIVDEGNSVVTMGEYLRKQWNGQRAKRTRRSLRRGSSHAFKYLQTGFQGPNLIPDVTQIAVAFKNNDTRGRY